jgi:hypothetical protein
MILSTCNALKIFIVSRASNQAQHTHHGRTIYILALSANSSEEMIGIAHPEPAVRFIDRIHDLTGTIRSLNFILESSQPPVLKERGVDELVSMCGLHDTLDK